MVKNSAFVFIKPHAVTDKSKELVKETFEKQNFKIIKDGEILAEEIDKKMLVDKHYYSIASKATLKKPSELNVPKDKFKDQFGLDWDEALKEEKVFNAKEACEKLEVDSAKLDSLWAAAKKAKKLVKFGGGFYCGEIENGDKKIYVMNGFFMAMRSKFVAPGTSIYYYLVEWEKEDCSWADFRGKVLGPTDPADAPADSLRGMIAKQWKELGLKAECNVGDNGVHASASPFEALAERINWLGYRADRDNFGKLLLKAGVSRGLIKDWSNDPQVTYGVLPITGSLFDSVEDTDSDYCLALCGMMASFQGEKESKKSSNPLDKEVERLKEQLAMYESLAKAAAAIQAFKPVAEEKSESKGKGKGKGKKESEGKGKKEGEGKGKGEGKGAKEGGGGGEKKSRARKDRKRYRD